MERDMKRFLASRVILGLSALLFAYAAYNLNGLTSWWDYPVQLAASRVLWLLGGAIVMAIIGAAVGWTTQPSRWMSRQYRSLEFSGVWLLAVFMVTFTAFFEKEKWIPVGLGLWVTYLAVVVLMIIKTLYVRRRFLTYEESLQSYVD